MTTEPTPADRFAECLRLLRELHRPMTDDEKREHELALERRRALDEEARDAE